MLSPESKSQAEYLRHPVRHGKFNALLRVGWMVREETRLQNNRSLLGDL
jgi:hypothetical protein